MDKTSERKRLKIADQEDVIKLVVRYQSVHAQINELEAQMEKIGLRKDELLKELEMSRTDEEFLMSKLSFEYGGTGKIDPKTMEWVFQELTEIKTEEYDKSN